MAAYFSGGGGAMKFAEGGLIPGQPSRRDNRFAAVATGEFIHPSDVVSYYGAGVMEALRNRDVPREVFAGLAGHAPRVGRGSFALGGLVSSAGMLQPSVGGGGSGVNVFFFDNREAMFAKMKSVKGKRMLVDALSGRVTEIG